MAPKIKIYRRAGKPEWRSRDHKSPYVDLQSHGLQLSSMVSVTVLPYKTADNDDDAKIIDMEARSAPDMWEIILEAFGSVPKYRGMLLGPLLGLQRSNSDPGRLEVSTLGVGQPLAIPSQPSSISQGLCRISAIEIRT